ncbi:MAG: thioredoxin [Wenzhouxiangella sp.]|nr:MAG: thioredoxin [Wenzhouxiangella sp.]
MPSIHYCLKSATGLVLFLFALTANAGTFENYSSERLAELNAQGRPVLVEVYADWCSTCRRQSPLLEEMLAEADFSDLTALKLDWDEQRDQAKALGAPRQSTLILFRNGEALDLSIAETNPDRLREFLRQALN